MLLDEQIKLSKRRTLVVEDLILGGVNHLAQLTTDPHRDRARRDGRAVKSLAAKQPVALLVKSRQIPNPDDNVFVVKHYDDYDGVADLAHCREDEPLQFELHQCFAESMYAAQCGRCDGLGCERCCGDDGELDTCGIYGPAGRRTRSRRHALLLAPATQHDLKCDCAGIDPAGRRTRARRFGSWRGLAY